MATLSSLRTDVRSRIVEDTAAYFTDTEIDRWINQGYKRFISLTNWTEKIKAYPVVANQYEYNLPTDIKTVIQVNWEDKWSVEPADIDDFRANAGVADASSERPWMYTLYPWDSKIRVYPVPVAASASSTIDGAHSDSVTTISLVDASSFPSKGRVIINDAEQVLYYAKSGNDLLQCVRGDGYTTPASYTNESVKYAPLEIYMNYQPPDLATGVDTRIGPSYDEAIICYAVSICMFKKDLYQNGGQYRKMFDELVERAKDEKERRQKDKTFFVKDAEAGSYD